LGSHGTIECIYIFDISVDSAEPDDQLSEVKTLDKLKVLFAVAGCVAE
jgi:hypothetical protein